MSRRDPALTAVSLGWCRDAFQKRNGRPASQMLLENHVPIQPSYDRLGQQDSVEWKQKPRLHSIVQLEHGYTRKERGLLETLSLGSVGGCFSLK